jgi:putative addiction module killer protein
VDAREQEVLEYVRSDGKIPFRTWLRSLRDSDARARIRVRINRVRLGNFGDCRPVGNGVLELRIDYGPGYRVYLGRDGATVVLLLCGGVKKSQSRDIATAIEYWQDYQRRKR